MPIHQTQGTFTRVCVILYIPCTVSSNSCNMLWTVLGTSSFIAQLATIRTPKCRHVHSAAHDRPPFNIPRPQVSCVFVMYIAHPHIQRHHTHPHPTNQGQILTSTTPKTSSSEAITSHHASRTLSWQCAHDTSGTTTTTTITVWHHQSQCQWVPISHQPQLPPHSRQQPPHHPPHTRIITAHTLTQHAVQRQQVALLPVTLEGMMVGPGGV